jgi:hypothetical protein
MALRFSRDRPPTGAGLPELDCRSWIAGVGLPEPFFFSKDANAKFVTFESSLASPRQCYASVAGIAPVKIRQNQVILKSIRSDAVLRRREGKEHGGLKATYG